MNAIKRESIVTIGLITIFFVISIIILVSSITTSSTEELLLIPFIAGIFLYVHGIIQEDDELL